MDKIELSIEEVARLTGKSKEEIIAATQAEDGSSLEPKEISQKITGFIADKFAKIKTETAAQSLKNGLEKREKEAAKKFGIDSYEGWDDLFSQIAEKTASEGNDNTEAAKQIETLKLKAKEYAEALKQAKAELTQVKTDFEYKATFSAVKNAAMSHVENFAKENNLNLPSDPAQRKKALERLLEIELNGQKFKSENGKTFILGEDGMPKMDENMNPITVENLAERTIQQFYTPISTPQNNGSNIPPPQGNGGSGFTFSKEDLMPANYTKKALELKASGNKEALDALTKQYRDFHKY